MDFAAPVRWLLLLTMLMGGGCAHEARSPDMRLTTLPVLPVTAATPAHDALFSVHVTQAAAHYDVLLVLARRETSFTLRALSELGLTLFQWPVPTGEAVTSTFGAVVRSNVRSNDPEVVVRLLQLTLWPLQDWQSALTHSQWRVVASAAASGALFYQAREVATWTHNDVGEVVMTACLTGVLADCAQDSRIVVVVTQLPQDAMPSAHCGSSDLFAPANKSGR